MKIRFFWTNQELRADNATLAKELTATENAHAILFGKHLALTGQHLRDEQQIAALKLSVDSRDAELAAANRDLALTEKDFLRVDAELDRQVNQLRGLREELAALTTEVERYRAQASCDKMLAADARRRPGYAVYPPAPGTTLAADREWQYREIAKEKRADDTDEPDLGEVA